MKKSYILLTGGAGFIGSSVAYYLLERGCDIIIVDNYSNSDKSNIDKLPNQHKILTFDLDICNYEMLEEIFLEYKINSIIHFAGLKSVAESIDKPILYYENNLVGSLNLLKLVDKYKIKDFIFSSSATVYGSEQPPLTEYTPTGNNITNPYGQTKYFIEKMIIDYSKTNKYTCFTILRYFNPVGSIKNGLLVENPKGKPNNLMPVIINSIKNNTTINVFGNDYPTPDGTAMRDYIHIEDLAKGHIYSLFNSNKSNLNIYNLGTGNPISVFDIIETFECVNNIKINYQIVDRRPGDLAIVFCDPTKALQELGWKAEKTLDEMCRDSYASILSLSNK